MASHRRRSGAEEAIVFQGQEEPMKAVVVAPGQGRFIAVGSAGTGVTVKCRQCRVLRLWWHRRVLLGHDSFVRGLAVQAAVRTVIVVVILPLTKLFVEEVNVVGDAARGSWCSPRWR